MIRIILGLIIAFAVYFIIKASIQVKKKKLIFISAFLGIVTMIFSSLFPIENAFIHFKTAEQVFSYTQAGTIEKIIDGKESCLVIYSEDKSTYGQYIIPKTENGYKIPNSFLFKQIQYKFDKNGIFEVFQVTGTQDFYVSGTVHLKERDNTINIFNDKNQKIESDIFRLENSDFIYFYLPTYSDEYYLMINGDIVPISE